MPTPFAVTANNVVALVGSAGYTAGSGTLTLAGGQGAQFPALTGLQFYRLTVIQQSHAYDPLATPAQLTIFKATGRLGDTFTGLVAMEGTTDRAYAGGDVVDVRVTAGSLGDVHAAINTIENAHSFVCNGRLTTVGGDPVNLVGVSSGSGTIYFSPYQGNRIALYNGSTGWDTIPFAATGVAVVSSPVGCYDVFAWNNNGTMNLEMSAVWSTSGFGTNGAGVRTDALGLQDGIYVKASNHTRRYLGTFYAQTGNNTFDNEGVAGTPAQRMVWNYYNRVRKHWYCEQNPGGGSWIYASNVWRLFNGNLGNNSAANLMAGLTEDTIDSLVSAGFGTSGPNAAFQAGVFFDQTTSPLISTGWNFVSSGTLSINISLSTSYAMPQGLHYFGGAESCPNNQSITLFAPGSGTSIQGWLWC